MRRSNRGRNSMTEDPPLADKATVLAWMASTGRGYKAASREFGVPRSTIQSWKQGEARTSLTTPATTPTTQASTPSEPAKPRGRPRTRAREPDPEEPWDPNDCTREDWLRRGMVRAMERSRHEHGEGHSGNAVRYETLAIRYRDELDKLLEEQRLAGLAPAAVDLVSMSREHAELLPTMVRMDPATWRPSVILAVVELAKYEGGVWAEFAERLKGAR